jgi:anti-anti-sigma factor
MNDEPAPAGDARLRTSVVDDVLLASFSGGLQGLAAARFEGDLVIAEEAEVTSVLLDLRGVSFVDGAGLALLIDTARRARKANRHLCVLSSPQVYGMFCGTGLLQAFATIGLANAVELVHPCTLDVLTRLGWLHGADVPAS